MLPLISIANLAFVHGMRTAAVIVGCLCCGLFLPVVKVYGHGVLDAVAQTVPIVVFAAFVLGMTSAVAAGESGTFSGRSGGRRPGWCAGRCGSGGGG